MHGGFMVGGKKIGLTAKNVSTNLEIQSWNKWMDGRAETEEAADCLAYDTVESVLERLRRVVIVFGAGFFGFGRIQSLWSQFRRYENTFGLVLLTFCFSAS